MRHLLVVLCLMMAGCETASVPMAPQAADAAGRQFQAEPGRGALYVYRRNNVALGSTISVPTYLDGRPLGSLGAQTWFRTDVAPGEHEIRCVAEDSGAVMVNLAPGDVRYVEIVESWGVWAARCAVREVGAAGAQPAILAGRRAAAVPTAGR